MEKPFAAYKGDLPYIFVCYAHEDSNAVFPEISWLHDQGVKIWYDEGISPGLEWSEALASAIQGSSKILFFVTPHSVTSEHCRRELNFAQEERNLSTTLRHFVVEFSEQSPLGVGPQLVQVRAG